MWYGAIMPKRSKYDNMPDRCQVCEAKGILTITYPKEIKRNPRKSGLVAYYTCDKGHVWTCHWSMDHWRD